MKCMEQRGQIDTSIQIVTPENIAFRYQLAGPFQRLPAFLIDFGVRVATMLAVAIALAILGFISSGLAWVLLLLAYFVLSWFYGVLFETYFNGQTPGKRVLDLRVLTDQGRPINGEQAVLRNLFRLADISFPLVSLIAASCSRRFQRLGDLVAGTIVIVEESRRLTHVVDFSEPGVAELVSSLPVDMRITRDMAHCLQSYVNRRHRLNSSQRTEIAGHLAVPLLTIYGLPNTTDHDMLLCAMYCRAFVGDRMDKDALAARAGDRLPAAAAVPAEGSPFGPAVVPQETSPGVDG